MHITPTYKLIGSKVIIKEGLWSVVMVNWVLLQGYHHQLVRELHTSHEILSTTNLPFS